VANRSVSVPVTSSDLERQGVRVQIVWQFFIITLELFDPE